MQTALGICLIWWWCQKTSRVWHAYNDAILVRVKTFKIMVPMDNRSSLPSFYEENHPFPGSRRFQKLWSTANSASKPAGFVATGSIDQVRILRKPRDPEAPERPRFRCWAKLSQASVGLGPSWTQPVVVLSEISWLDTAVDSCSPGLPVTAGGCRSEASTRRIWSHQTHQISRNLRIWSLPQSPVAFFGCGKFVGRCCKGLDWVIVAPYGPYVSKKHLKLECRWCPNNSRILLLFGGMLRVR